jgi:hypothetical protein
MTMRLNANSAIAVVSFLAVTAVAHPALAGPEHGRGRITQIDAGRQEMQLRDTMDRLAIWKVARDVSIKVSDNEMEFRDVKFKDLQVGMFLNYVFEGETSVIQSIDVKEGAHLLRKQQPTTSTAPKTGTVEGSVNSTDLSVAQIEIRTADSPRKTFQAANARVLAGLKAGDRVRLTTEKNEKGQDIVVQAQVTGSGDDDNQGRRRRR